jgi:pimeloyl-ACP methyl ester carboxylesterase
MLRRRLTRDLGCRTLSFSYPSVNAGLMENARSLAAYLGRVPTDTLHLVGHSMGGLLILQLFELGCAIPPGRIVLLASPVQGSGAARRLAGWRLGPRIMGRTAQDALLRQTRRRWSGARDLGIIAGSVAIGLGRLVGPFGEPNDGTVLVSETRIENARAHLTLPTTHSGMLYSPTVAQQTAAFLREGRFAQPGG